jgi:hypothetical protein
MRAEPVDPRTSRWERYEVAYRVYFWRQPPAPRGGWASEEWRVTEADIREVLDWADQRADGRYITAWIETTMDGESGLVRLTGWEPTRNDPPPDWVTH